MKRRKFKLNHLKNPHYFAIVAIVIIVILTILFLGIDKGETNALFGESIKKNIDNKIIKKTPKIIPLKEPIKIISVPEFQEEQIYGFGLYDLERSEQLSPIWRLLTPNDLIEHRDEIIRSYNDNRGFKVIRNFRSGNCCVSLSDGSKFTISGTPYGYQFISNQDGSITCNPFNGYIRNQYYKFYRLRFMDEYSILGSREACTTNHNPALYVRLVPEQQELQEEPNYGFGLYDLERPEQLSPTWRLLTPNDLIEHRDEIIRSYNDNRGFKVIRNFRSGNCCVSLSDGSKFTISGTPYGYQFISNQDGSITCNPFNGYIRDQYYKFYRLRFMDEYSILGSREACTTNHNPALYIRSLS